MRACLSALVMLTSTLSAFAGQAPSAAKQPDFAVSEQSFLYIRSILKYRVGDQPSEQ